MDSQGATFTIETTYTIHYSNKKPVPIPEIIESLQNVERLLKRTPKFIEAAFQGINVTNVEVYVDQLYSGSLTENFIVKYVFRNKANYDKAKEVFDEIMTDNGPIKTVVAMGVGALLSYGAYKALGGPSAPPTQITAYDNNIINIGGQVKLDAKGIKAILESVKDKKSLAKEAVKVIAPAKADPDAEIEMSGFDELTISKDYIREVPKEYTPPIPSEKEEKYQNVRVVIYASDRDKAESSWAGIVPGVVDKRVKFTLQGVDPKRLHGRTKVDADIVVISRYVASKKSYEAKVVEIHATN
ncbi:hypothetical protein [Gilvimarinus agarilyticus]|uniref:hypothetical protein n=1 Tax=Gilvimarinus agarilyticus TaxID=679259 RepID=UPI0005A039BE|nr:hypothetical protein [Gilvimarinus agarilyticus]